MQAKHHLLSISSLAGDAIERKTHSQKAALIVLSSKYKARFKEKKDGYFSSLASKKKYEQQAEARPECKLIHISKRRNIRTLRLDKSLSKNEKHILALDAKSKTQGEQDMFLLNLASARKYLAQRKKKTLSLGILPHVVSDNGRHGLNSYIKKYNKLHPNGSYLSDLYSFVSALPIKAASKNTITQAFVQSLKIYFGAELCANLELDYTIRSFRNSFRKKVKVNKKIAISFDELCKFVERAPVRYALMAEIMFHTGMRATELTKLRWDQCRPQENGHYLLSYRQKGNTMNTVEVRGDLVRRIRKVFDSSTFLFEKKNGKPYKYSGIHRAIVSSSMMSLGYKITPHDLRRAYATTMIQHFPKQIQQIMRRAGWVSVEVFMKHYVSEEKLSADAIPDPSALMQAHNSEARLAVDSIPDPSLLSQAIPAQTDRTYETKQQELCNAEQEQELFGIQSIKRLQDSNGQLLFLFTMGSHKSDSTSHKKEKAKTSKAASKKKASLIEDEKIKRLREASKLLGKARKQLHLQSVGGLSCSIRKEQAMEEATALMVETKAPAKKYAI